MGSVQTLIGRGIYDAPEIARLTGVPSRQVGRWAGPASIGGGLLLPTDRGLLTFWDLITARVTGMLLDGGAQLRKIRDARDHLRSEIDFDWPLAHYAGLRRLGVSGQNVWVKDDDGAWSDASLGGQRPFDEMAEPWVARVEFDRLGPASAWRPFDGVVLDPQVQAGSPCVDGTRLTTRFLADLHSQGESVEDLAWAYELDPDLVDRAVKYEERLSQAA